MTEWWRTFFDLDYFRLWEGAEGSHRTDLEVAGLWSLLRLRPGTRVLDAPCGYGRIAKGLAQRGAIVLGIDQSADLLAEAERQRDDVSTQRLAYKRADLREPLSTGNFDVALNIFSSVGYGTEDDDIRSFSTLRAALRTGGIVFVETAHRDWATSFLRHGQGHGDRLPDGTLKVEMPRFDPVSGRIDSDWYWSGPAGSGHKRSSLRMYAASELARLLETAGLRVQSAHNGCTAEPFVGSGAGMSRRLGLLAVRD